jgi:hypothetical protein
LQAIQSSSVGPHVGGTVFAHLARRVRGRWNSSGQIKMLERRESCAWTTRTRIASGIIQRTVESDKNDVDAGGGFS